MNQLKEFSALKADCEDKPLPVMGSNLYDIEKIVDMSYLARSLAQRFWPGALTIISPCKDNNLSKKVMAGGSSLAVRIPANICAQTLLRSCKYLIGTSANVSGSKPCTSPFDILSSGLSGFDILLDGGKLERGIESTVVEVTGSKARILREGAIEFDKVYKAISEILNVRPELSHER